MSADFSTHSPSNPAPRSRRDFLKSTGAAVLAGAAAPLWWPAASSGSPTADSAAEQTVQRFYQSLTEPQRETLVLPFDHELRTKISANWHITKPVIGDDFFSDDQRKLIDEIVRGVTSPEGYERILRQTRDDDGGLEGYSVAVFGEPGKGPFEFALTGRHLTLRADGNSDGPAAFGGPLIYGHGETNPKQNLFYPQTRQVNEVFRSLDPKQVEQALIEKAPAEGAVARQGRDGRFPGLSVQSLSADQRKLVDQTLKLLLAPYRAEDVEEVWDTLREQGGVESLHLAFYREGDLLEDQTWDIWRIEGPGFVWHFRGAPHVHAYINIARTA